MINTKVTFKDENKKIQYPWLGIDSDSMVVLFTEPRIGTVVKRPNLPRTGSCLGDHTTTWLMSTFKHFTGTLELSNKD